MRRAVLAGVSLATLVLGVAVVGRDTLRPEPTPLAGFTAPFVFGRFAVPADNPLTEEAVALGRRLFYEPRLSGNNAVSCSTCHMQRLAFTDGRPTGVGVSGKPLVFNSMSLANLMWGPQRFFWNGRVATLEEQVLIPLQHPDEMAQDPAELVDELSEDVQHYNEGIRPSSTLSPLIAEADNLGTFTPGRVSLNLTDEEQAAIIAFLHTLTDEEFVNAERFADPFATE